MAKQKVLAQTLMDNLEKPSIVTDTYWIFASRQKGKYPEPTDNRGKWLVFTSVAEVDAVWSKIRTATREGKLGNDSKVATAKDSPYGNNQTGRVICIYTYDWTDEKDVMKIRDVLRKLGITGKIPYKANESTFNREYSIFGHKKISKYYC